MRLDLLYILGTLWSGLPETQVCPASLPAFSGIALGASWTSFSRVPSAVTAFVGVNVVPMDTERVLADQTVLVEGGRITALGPANQVPLPTGAVRIDGQGKYLIPGLADMHVHKIVVLEGRMPAVQKFLVDNLAAGVTALRTLEGPDLEEMKILRRFITTPEIPSPRLYLARSLPISIGPGGIATVLRSDSVAAHVAASKATGYDHIGTGFSMMAPPRDPALRPARLARDRAAFDSLVAAASRVGLPISAHSHSLPFDALLALGTTGGSTEHLSTVFYHTLGISKRFSDENGAYMSAQQIVESGPPTEVPISAIVPLAQALKRAGTWVTPTLHCHENGDRHKVAVSATSFRAMVKVLHDAGVGLLLSGDDGGTVHDELVALVRAGLSPYQALVTGTRNVAQYFRVLDSAGTVSVGKQADLVLLDGNPLTDIRHTRKLAGVMVAGRWLDRAALDQQRRTP